MAEHEIEVDLADLANELSEDERVNGMPTCRIAHSVSDSNCTGVCQRREGHIDAGHRDQFGHWY
jgi:hypothetical protein